MSGFVWVLIGIISAMGYAGIRYALSDELLVADGAGIIILILTGPVGAGIALMGGFVWILAEYGDAPVIKRRR